MLIIGISGGTGCGKTTLVKQVVDAFPKTKITVISQDSYYRDTSHLNPQQRREINFDHPESIDFDLLTAHLTALKNNQSIEQPVYSFVTHNRTGETIPTQPSQVIIVEGILVLTPPKLRAMFDIKIFVEADADERLIRRLKRDTLERGRDLDEVLTRYKTTLKPMYNQFIAPTKHYADIIIPNNNYNLTAVSIIKKILKEAL